MHRQFLPSIRRRLVFPLVVLLPILVAGCASLGAPFGPAPRYLEAGPDTVACARFFHALDLAVNRAGVTDVQEARVSGFPYLRVNRFLAADWRPAPDDTRLDDWARRLMNLDRHARDYEIANLPPSFRAGLPAHSDGSNSVSSRVEDCGEILLAHDLSHRDSRERLSDRAAVPDAYRDLYRVAGLYPLTSIPFYVGVKGFQDEIEREFSVPLGALAVKGELIRYVPASSSAMASEEIAQLLRRASDNPLRLPDPDADERARLFEAFAPVLEIDVMQDADRIGRPGVYSSPIARIDTKSPVVYTKLSYARFESKTLLQLNYVFWFPSRPKSGAFDILAGHLDGITWRVTLDEDGTPLIYDAMHNCGCYHLFLPTQKLRLRNSKRGFEEPLLLPQRASWRGGRAGLRIASRSHYLQRLFVEPARGTAGTAYQMEAYTTLRSLPTADGGRRSLFGEDGLVRGSERPERWLFWPMGVPSAGAMRQWGRHATAFVGRRHFDDPDLIARYFERDTGR